MKKLSIAVLIAALATLAACPRLAPKVGVREDRRSDDINAYIAAELDAGRDAWQKPDEVIAALAIQPGQTVADASAGAGYFTWRLSKAVGDKGRVFAVESNPDLLALLIKSATEGGYSNVKVVEAGANESNLPYKSTDVALICNATSRVDFIHLFFDDIRRALKNGGKLAVIDWKPGTKTNASNEQPFAPKEIIALLEAAGFKLVKEYDFLPNQYFLVFELMESYE